MMSSDTQDKASEPFFQVSSSRLSWNFTCQGGLAVLGQGAENGKHEPVYSSLLDRWS